MAKAIDIATNIVTTWWDTDQIASELVDAIANAIVQDRQLKRASCRERVHQAFIKAVEASDKGIESIDFDLAGEHGTRSIQSYIHFFVRQQALDEYDAEPDEDDP